MMPAKSTSDHRTYSSMMYGLAGIASRTVEPEREARGGQTPKPARPRALDARRWPRASVPVRPEPIGTQPAPQRGTADTESSRGLGQLTVRHLEGVEDGLALSLGQGRAVAALRHKHDFAELKRALLESSGPCAERNEALAQVLAAMRHAIPKRIERTPRPLIRIHHPPIGVEDDHAFAECFHYGLPERGEARWRWETGVLFSRRHTSLHSRFGGSRFQTAQPLGRPAERPEVTVRNASLSDAGPACHPAPGAAVPPGIVRSTGGAGRPTSPTAPLRACPGAP